MDWSNTDTLSKVPILLKGITMPQYDVMKVHILASIELKTSFARSVELYKDFIKETKAKAPRNVCADQGVM
jgi:hypothetical protein